MNADFDPFTLVLLVGAAIVMWKLKSVLGTKTGFEKPHDPEKNWSANKKSTEVDAQPNTKQPELGAAPDVLPPVWQNYAAAGSPTASTLERIAKADPQFDMKPFMVGAKQAYEMIVEAYAKGDKAALKPLLTPETYDGFVKEIDRRIKAKETVTMQFVGIDKVELHDVRLDGSIATISLRFASEMISASLDDKGVVLSGDEKNLRQIVDVWSFERDMTSRNPNWKLAATDDPFE